MSNLEFGCVLTYLGGDRVVEISVTSYDPQGQQEVGHFYITKGMIEWLMEQDDNCHKQGMSHE